MDDDEYLKGLQDKVGGFEMSYHEICLWLPHKPETVGDIAKDMSVNGFRVDRAIITYEGKILDGRHRYEAALQSGVDPIFSEFQGTKEEAISYVTSENVARRHLNSREKEFFYVKMTDYLGVRSRGGSGSNQHQSGNPKNFGIAPSTKNHAENLGVTSRTVENWEKDRKDIKSDPELSKEANTLAGYVKAKKVVKKRRATQAESNKIAKLKSLGERSEAESSNVERKLDRYREEGIDVDAVESEGDRDRARDQYRRKHEPIEEMAKEIAKILIDTKDYNFVAAITKAAYSRSGELENAYNIITAEGN